MNPIELFLTLKSLYPEVKTLAKLLYLAEQDAIITLEEKFALMDLVRGEVIPTKWI